MPSSGERIREGPRKSLKTSFFLGKRREKPQVYKMTDGQGNVMLSGFEMDPAEKAIVDNIIRNYSHKIGERADIDYLKLRLKKSEKAKTFLHAVEGELKIKNKAFRAKETGYNLFSVLADVLERLLNELVHTERTSRQRR